MFELVEPTKAYRKVARQFTKDNVNNIQLVMNHIRKAIDQGKFATNIYDNQLTCDLKPMLHFLNGLGFRVTYHQDNNTYIAKTYITIAWDRGYK